MKHSILIIVVVELTVGHENVEQESSVRIGCLCHARNDRPNVLWLFLITADKHRHILRHQQTVWAGASQALEFFEDPFHGARSYFSSACLVTFSVVQHVSAIRAEVAVIQSQITHELERGAIRIDNFRVSCRFFIRFHIAVTVTVTVTVVIAITFTITDVAC